jgi:hypothetical protein
MAKLEPTKIEVWTDGRDTELVVLADQRDFAAWEAAAENDPERQQPSTMTRWIAWNAARRAGQITSSFAKFNSTECISAIVMSEPEDQEDEEGDDPSQT